MAGDVVDRDLTSQVLVEYAMDRIEKGGVQPQTVGNDLSHLGAVLTVARPAWGYEVDPVAMADARRVLRKMGGVSRSNERDRRPTLEELDTILAYFVEMRERRKQQIDMVRMIGFAIFSTRRQEEITRIRWDAIDEARQAVLITDMKNPGQKYGNDVWCHLPDQAWRILHSMPRREEFVFPYNAKSVSASFTRACSFLEIDDLHFHDLRHEFSQHCKCFAKHSYYPVGASLTASASCVAHKGSTLNSESHALRFSRTAMGGISYTSGSGSPALLSTFRSTSRSSRYVQALGWWIAKFRDASSQEVYQLSFAAMNTGGRPSNWSLVMSMTTPSNSIQA